jgi:hypothetical protein
MKQNDTLLLMVTNLVLIILRRTVFILGRTMMKVPAPKGYHWMKSGKEYKLMKDPAGGYKPHKGASKSADFAVQKVHKK